jgi:hypothetical protein
MTSKMKVGQGRTETASENNPPNLSNGPNLGWRSTPLRQPNWEETGRGVGDMTGDLPLIF